MADLRDTSHSRANVSSAPDSLGQGVDAVLACAAAALRDWSVRVSGFVDPQVRILAEQELRWRSDLHWLCWGGLSHSERQRLLIAHRDLPLEQRDVPLALAELRGNFLFDPAQWDDFEAALHAVDPSGHSWGDLQLLGDRGAQLIHDPAALPTLREGCRQVRSVAVELVPLPWEQLRFPQRGEKRFSTVEASCRLDAVTSAGFGLSRSKLVEQVRAGLVRVNWCPVHSPSHRLKQGDLVSLRGRGQLLLESCDRTRRDRWRLHLLRR